MLRATKSYEEACRIFRWKIPDLYNLAFDMCDRQTMAGSDGHRTALIVESADGKVERFTFHMLRLLSNRLANVLADQGVIMGERVLISLPPSVEAAVGLLAILKLGAVAVPVSPLLGQQPLAWRLADSGAIAAIVGRSGAPILRQARQAAPALLCSLIVDGPDCQPQTGEMDFWPSLEGASDQASPLVTAADDPAMLFYPNQASGKPFGVLHAHRMLLGNLPPVEFALGFFPQIGDIAWTSADWMDFGALAWAVFPAWHHGVTVVAGPLDATPEQKLALMGRQGVRTVHAPTEQLVALAQAALKHPHPIPRAIATGPAALTAAQADLVRKVFDCTANEIWGSVEIGAAVANQAGLMEYRSGSPGRAMPGVSVEAVDIAGRVLRADETGWLAVSPNAPGAMLARWNDPAPNWGRMETGWLAAPWRGRRDLDGYIWIDPQYLPDGWVWMQGQPVDLAELTQCLLTHPKVDQAAVSQTPEGELKAILVLVSGENGDLTLGREIQDFVAARRAVTEMPTRIAFRKAGAGLDTPTVRLDAPSPDERW